jgi:ABC-2 type transport system permease protein
MEYYPDIDRYLGFLLPSFNKYLPNNWLSEVLYWILNENISQSYGYTILLNLLFIFSSTIAILLGHKWYNFTWLSGIGNSQKNNEIIKIPKFSFGDSSFLKPVEESILKRELYLFIREPSQILHFLVLYILILIFILSLNGISLEDTYNSELKSILYLSMYLFNLLIITTLSLRFVFPLISLEGREFWRIKSSPVSINKYLRKKINPYFFVILFTGLILSFFPAVNVDKSFALIMGIITVFTTSLIFYLNYGMGSIFTKFDEKNPIRIASSQGASLSFLFSTIYMIFIVSLLFVPIRNFFDYYTRKGIYDISILYFPLLIIILSTFLSMIFISILIKTKTYEY